MGRRSRAGPWTCLERRWAPLRDPPASGLELAGGHLAVLRVAFQFVGDLLAFAQRAEARAFNRGDVNEHVGAARIRLDEAEAFLAVEPFDSTGSHLDLVLNMSRSAPCGRPFGLSKSVRIGRRVRGPVEDQGAWKSGRTLANSMPLVWGCLAP